MVRVGYYLVIILCFSSPSVYAIDTCQALFGISDLRQDSEAAYPVEKSSKNFYEIMSLGFDRQSFAHLPKGIVAQPPQAKDAITPESYPGLAGYPITRITVKNDEAYTQPYGIAKGNSDPIRAEYTTINDEKTHYREGDTRIYRISLMLDSSWIPDRRESPDIVMQFKRTQGQPDVFVAIKGKDMVVRIGEREQMTIINEVEAGQWVDLFLKVKWSKKNGGRIEIAYRYSTKSETYRRSVNYRGPTLPSREGKTYLKFGIYKPGRFADPPFPQEHILYITNFAVLSPAI